jgi:2-oxo-3-hexenedioate decarboxylase
LGLLSAGREQANVHLALLTSNVTSTETTADADIHAIADEVFATIGTGRQIAPFTSRPGGLTLDGSYRVTALLNKRYEARGDKKLGRKIGFTNRTIWEQCNVSDRSRPL